MMSRLLEESEDAKLTGKKNFFFFRKGAVPSGRRERERERDAKVASESQALRLENWHQLTGFSFSPFSIIFLFFSSVFFLKMLFR